jgi:8-amino-7-oxononanoate synthase
VFSDSANHASLIDGIRLTKAAKVVFPHSDLDFLESALQRARSGERIIVVESIFSMDGDRAPLADLYRLAERYDASLIIDEAHATGVAGPRGSGLVAADGRPDCVLATVHTCGKALASAGAFVAGSQMLRQYLINKSRPFIFSTALPPYVAAQTDAALTLVEAADDRRARLQELAGYLAAELPRLGFPLDRSRSHIVPVVLGSNSAALRAAAYLKTRGFGVKAIRPPTVPQGTARLRLSLTSRLSHDELAALVRALSDVV